MTFDVSIMTFYIAQSTVEPQQTELLYNYR